MPAAGSELWALRHLLGRRVRAWAALTEHVPLPPLQVGVDGIVTNQPKLVKDAIEFKLQRC